MTGYAPHLVTRSLTAPRDLFPGASFQVPSLSASWWTVDHLVDLVADEDGQAGRVRVVLAETDRRGRPYGVELHHADRVVWASTLAPRALALVGLGHHVWCSGCGVPWGWLPVTVCNTLCFTCDTAAPVGI